MRKASYKVTANTVIRKVRREQFRPRHLRLRTQRSCQITVNLSKIAVNLSKIEVNHSKTWWMFWS